MPYTIKRFRNMKSMYGGAIYCQNSAIFDNLYASVPIFSIEPKERSAIGLYRTSRPCSFGKFKTPQF